MKKELVWKKYLIEIAGWYGTAAILLAYSASSFGGLATTSPIYQWLNLTGALGLIIDTVWKRDLEPAVLNVVWFSIALIALARMAMPG